MPLHANVISTHKWLQTPVQEMSQYNCWDCYNTGKTYPKLVQELKDNGQWDYYQNRVWPLVDPVLAIQQRGLHLYPEHRHDIQLHLSRERREVESIILEAAGWPPLHRGDPNPLNSPKQKCWLLYDRLGFKVPVRAGKPVRSSDQAALMAILSGLRKKDQGYVPILHSLFHRSRLNTILTRYLKVYADPDGRVRPRVKLWGTETGRFAYSDPPIQQYPPEARPMFGAAPGNTWVSADYSQLEARILAYLSHDTASIAVFESGGDVHAQNAMDLFNYTPTQWEGLEGILRKALRNFAKTFLYGISYGGSPATLKTKLYCPCYRCTDKVPPTYKIGRNELATASQRWFHLHAPVLRWRERLSQEVRSTHSYTNPFGRKRYFCTPWPTVETELFNYPMQSTAADIINDCIIRLHNYYQAPIVLQMHDELILEVPDTPDWIASTIHILRSTMEHTVPELGGVTFPVDLKVGPVWGEQTTIS